MSQIGILLLMMGSGFMFCLKAQDNNSVYGGAVLPSTNTYHEILNLQTDITPQLRVDGVNEPELGGIEADTPVNDGVYILLAAGVVYICLKGRKFWIDKS